MLYALLHSSPNRVRAHCTEALAVMYLHMQSGMQLDCIAIISLHSCFYTAGMESSNEVVMHSFCTESEMYNDLWVQIVVVG